MKKSILLFLIPILFSACMASRTVSILNQQQSKDLIDAGALALEEGSLEIAIARFEMAFALSPSAEALDGLGCVALYRGKLDEAEQYFKLALSQNPEYHRALGHIALIREMQGERQQAEALFREYLFQEPENIRMRNNFAVFLSDSTRKEKRDEARRELLRAMSIEQHNIIEENYRLVEKTYEE